MSYLLMALIVIVAVVASLWPLWASRVEGGMRRRALNVAGYKQRLREIEADVEAGTVDEAAVDALRDETAARLLADAAEDDPAMEPAAQPARRSWAGVAVGAVLIALVSGLGYYFSESRQIAGWIAAAGEDPAAGQRLVVEGMVRRLETRLERQPEDAQGWAMLGRSYFVQGRHADAVGAYERANRLTSVAPDADWLADEAEARLYAQGAGLQGLPRQLFERALAVDPAQPKALWYAGLAAAQAQDYGAALDRWLALRELELPEDFRSVLEQRLPELAELAQRELPPASAAPQGVRLMLDISIAEALAGEVGAGSVLFVFARQPEVGGPPLAVRRLGAQNLPVQLTLDDSNAMVPGAGLSTAERWQVVARVSRSGDVQPRPGDLEGSVLVSRGEAGAPVRLQIDRRVQ